MAASQIQINAAQLKAFDTYVRCAPGQELAVTQTWRDGESWLAIVLTFGNTVLDSYEIRPDGKLVWPHGR